eukprot:UN28404
MLNSERCIRQAVKHGLEISLVINKVDRLICELRLFPEDAYLKLAHTVNEVNKVLADAGSEQIVSPLKGNVCFASAIHGWSFTLPSFASIYSYYHPGVKSDQFAKHLWGDIWMHKDRRFRKTAPADDANRTFVQFIMEPIHKIYSHVLGQNPDELGPLLEELDIKLNASELNLNPKPLLTTVLSRFFSHSQGFVQMLVDHVPSPVDGNK